ncbi:hypothetical protein TIFTF001_037913 [Ficus carica]|uniref:Phytocyanin domain-containing protein n=1 Tax=Ficus carica TaxID=3494 RepID=A0AA88E6U6_FICCA|nr:hypothetical protein TIFTF001_037913 [Ficus carica]
MERRTVGLVVVLLAVILAERSSDAATTYEVGGSTRWVIPPNTSFYEEWAEGKTFHVGDILSFNWTHVHNVANVTKEEYENCTKISSVIGSPALITLESPGHYYYICTVGTHCSRGQKLEIEVSSSNSSTPVGSLSPRSSSSSCVPLGALSATVAILVVSFLS